MLIIAQVVDHLLNEHAFLLLECSPPFIQAYLAFRNSEEHCLEVWHALLSAVVQQTQKGFVLMTPILDAARRGRLPSHLKPRADELDAAILKWVLDAMEGSAGAGDIPLIGQVLHVAGELVYINKIIFT